MHCQLHAESLYMFLCDVYYSVSQKIPPAVFRHFFQTVENF